MLTMVRKNAGGWDLQRKTMQTRCKSPGGLKCVAGTSTRANDAEIKKKSIM